MLRSRSRLGLQPQLVVEGPDHRPAQARLERARGALDVDLVERLLDHLGVGDLAADEEAQIARGQRHRVVDRGVPQALRGLDLEAQRIAAAEQVAEAHRELAMLGADRGRAVVGEAEGRLVARRLDDVDLEPALAAPQARAEARVDLVDRRVEQEQLDALAQLVDVERRAGAEPDPVDDELGIERGQPVDHDVGEPALDDLDLDHAVPDLLVGDHRARVDVAGARRSAR